MSNLSLCMIVKDEESNLNRFLSTCSDVFDEIIIVDTGSTDKTKEVAQKYKAKIFDLPWAYDFSKARNFSFQQATSKYIQWNDADDYFYPDEVNKLRELKKEFSTSDVVCYKLVYKYNSEISGYNLRIVKNSPEIFWKYPVHESLIIPNGSKTMEKQITIEHWGAWKPERDSGILKRAYEGEWKHDGRMQHYYIREFYYHHDYEKVIELYRKHLHNIHWYTKFGAYYYYAESCFKTGRTLKALDLCKKAIKENPNFSDFYCLVGQYHFDNKRYQEAKKWYEMALGNYYPDNTSEVFMVRSNYGFEPFSKRILLEKILAAEEMERAA